MKVRITNSQQCEDAVEELELTSRFVEQQMDTLREAGHSESEIQTAIAPLIDHAVDLYQEILGYESALSAAFGNAN